LPGYDTSIQNVSPLNQQDFFAFYKVNEGTETQLLVFWKFSQSQSLSSSLYIFSRRGVNQDPSGEYEGQCLRIPPQDGTPARSLLNQGNIEELLRRTIDIQEQDKDVTHLTVQRAA